jgi:hypothetical protein
MPLNVTIVIFIGDKHADSHTHVVRHLTGVPALNNWATSFPPVSFCAVDPEEAQHQVARNNRLRVEVYPRRMQFGKMCAPQVSTPGLTRSLENAEAYGLAYARAVAYAREAETLALIWDQMVDDERESIMERHMKEMACRDLPGGAHPFGTQG